MSTISTRAATLEDATAILKIYRPYVEKTSISFELEAPSISEIKNRMTETLAKYPWLVCEIDGAIAGYAYAGQFRARAAYSRSVESALYVDSRFHGKGIGRRLYTDLFAILKRQNFTTVIAGITLPNQASVAIHEAFGFEKVGHLKNIGFKQNRWWDVGYWQLTF